MNPIMSAKNEANRSGSINQGANNVPILALLQFRSMAEETKDNFIVQALSFFYLQRNASSTLKWHEMHSN